MNTMTKMTLRTEGDTHIVVTRHFHAKPEARLPRPHRTRTHPEMAPGPRGLDHAGLH